ncbi:MAG: preprotein translocase subunit SecG [Chlamydiae bacterium SM23_39]|nr:MAG: preprotein translocase subunit SecG [Chlamydiae bacterium SM23_39]
MSFIFYFFLFVFFIVCILLIFIVLMQDSKSMGLGASFGDDTRDSVFGTATADVLKKITIYFATIFLISCLILSFWSSGLGRKRALEKEKAEKVFFEKEEK